MRYSRNSKPYQVLSIWLKQHRLEQGLSLRALAGKLELHHSIIGKIESGARKLDALELVVYCQVLGVDPKQAIEVIEKAMLTKGLAIGQPSDY
jgi:transcriptional regulator with XRE-family HTH domain